MIQLTIYCSDLQVVYILDQVRALENEMLLRIQKQGLEVIPKILIVYLLAHYHLLRSSCLKVFVIRVPIKFYASMLAYIGNKTATRSKGNNVQPEVRKS